MTGNRVVHAGIGLVTALFVLYFVTDGALTVNGLNVVIFALTFGGVWLLLALESGRRSDDRR